MKRLLALLPAALLAAACASTGRDQPRSSLADANALKASESLVAADVAASAWPAADWWKRFGDTQLDQLVDEALHGSPTLRVADARVRKALASAATLNAGRAPQVTGTADATRQRFSEHFIYPPPFAGSWVTTADLTANLNFDLDLWGKTRSEYEGALDQAHAAKVDRDAAQLLLSASVVHAYVQLQRAYEQLDIAQALFTQRDDLRKLVDQRKTAGLDSALELKQAEASLPEACERIAQLEETIALTRNQISALLGQGPDRGRAIERPHMASGAAPTLPSRLPADLIGRRPDIVAQRWRVEAAVKDTAAARADFYPNVNLVAFAGLQSIGLSNLVKSGSAVAGVGPALHLPILDGGRLRANLAGKQADYDIAVEQYNQSLADALRDVVDQLASFRSVDEQRAQADAAVGIAQDAYDLAVLRYREGLGNYLQVLSAESQVLGQKSLRADLAARGRDVSVNLARSLGGGYEPD
ncbi:MAG TPA: efflux transporter outer membrane subunit [Usitatibacter sp.]|nr:efflux transporter outer membrane subunit [Usitatibacter sp.]